ncbi:hypothetical protein KI387_022620, partial [Taxus chinensis]
MEEMMKNGEASRWGIAFGIWIIPIAVKHQNDLLEYSRVEKAYTHQKASFEEKFTYLFIDFLLSSLRWKAPAELTLRILSNITL